MTFGRARKIWAVGAAVATAYFVTGKFGLSLPVAEGNITPIWAPTGISLVALLLGGTRLWPAVFAGAFLVNVTTPIPVWVAGAIATGNTLEAIVGTYLLRRALFDPRMERVSDVLQFVIFGALAATAVSATVGTTALTLSGHLEAAEFDFAWGLWWFGDGMGALVIAPLLLSWGTRLDERIDLRRALEEITITAVVASTSWIVFFGGRWRYPYLLFPPIVWATLRFRQRGAAQAIFVVTAFSMGGILTGSVPVGGATVLDNVQILQALVGLVAMTALLLAATLSEQDQARRAIAREAGYSRLFGRVAEAANQARDIDQVLRLALDEVCEHTGWPVGHVYMVDRMDPERLLPTTIWHLDDPPERYEVFRRVSEGMPLRVGEGLPGRVLDGGSSTWIPDVTKDANFPRANAGAHIGVKGAFGFPIPVGDRIVGVVEFFSDRPVEPDEEMLAVVSQVGAQLGRVVERAEAEAALRDRAEEARLIVDTAGDAYISIDANSIVVDWNREAERMFGVQRAEALGRPMPELIMPERWRAPHRRGLARYVEIGEGPVLFTRVEFSAVRADGAEFPVELSVWPTGAGTTLRFHAFVRDISERRRIEAFREEFIANAAHELRTPITTITGFTDLLIEQRTALGAEEMNMALNGLQRSSTRLRDLANNLLDLTRIRAGKLQLKLGPVSLEHAVTRVLEAFPPPEGRVVDVSIASGATVVADEMRLDQIIVNVLSNAYRYGGRRIRVEGETHDGEVVLAISDDGPGVPPDLVPEMFDAFARGKESAGGGSGLGLAIVKTLVEASGGTVSYEPGEPSGARFILRLVRPSP